MDTISVSLLVRLLASRSRRNSERTRMKCKLNIKCCSITSPQVKVATANFYPCPVVPSCPSSPEVPSSAPCLQASQQIDSAASTPSSSAPSYSVSEAASRPGPRRSPIYMLADVWQVLGVLLSPNIPRDDTSVLTSLQCRFPDNDYPHVPSRAVPPRHSRPRHFPTAIHAGSWRSRGSLDFVRNLCWL